MTALGVFRDDYYNAVNALTNSQVTATTQASGTLAAAAIAGAVENYVTSSGATALTTDTAANIIAALQAAVTTALKAAGNQGGQPPGIPNLFNMTFFVQIANTNASTLTISAGTGVTLTGTATILTAATREWSVTVTGPASVVFTTLGGTVASSFVA